MMVLPPALMQHPILHCPSSLCCQERCCRHYMDFDLPWPWWLLTFRPKAPSATSARFLFL